jgi:hypothetical protein
LCLYLPFEISTQQIILLDHEPVLNGIDKERQLTPSLRILFGGALHLTLAEMYAHLGEHLTRFLQIKITGLFHRVPPYSL